MIHKLCSTCINTCKQDDHAKIVRCPKYQKRLSAEEFKSLVDELDVMEKEADMLRDRVRNLIDKVTDREDEIDRYEDSEDDDFDEE